MIAHLDYPAEKLRPFGREFIEMECTNEVEQSLRIVACAKEPWTVEFIEALPPGSVLWDIGANVGPYTLLAAARGVGVVAFEPVPETFARLSHNCALNNLLGKVELLPFGLSDGHGLLWLHRANMQPGVATNVIDSLDRTHPGEFHRQLIPIMTLDEAASYFALAPPNAIKLDVDGFEIPVLAGAEAVLKLPTLAALMIELNDQWDGKLTAWLAERGWVMTRRWENRGPIYYGCFNRAEVVAEIVARQNGHVPVDVSVSRRGPQMWPAPH